MNDLNFNLMTPKELTTVIAALRYFQEAGCPDDMPHFEDESPLEPLEIDSLCEELNVAGGYDLYVVVHEHKYGESVFPMLSMTPIDQSTEDWMDRVVEGLDIDFDQDRGENLTLLAIESKTIPVLT